jgi:shikimate kinase / 3-dehydroquinate synthase
VVYLRVGYDEALKRVQNDEFRPMLRRPDLGAVYRARLRAYEDTSAFVVDTDDRRPDDIARSVLEHLAALRFRAAGEQGPRGGGEAPVGLEP